MHCTSSSSHTQRTGVGDIPYDTVNTEYIAVGGRENIKTKADAMMRGSSRTPDKSVLA